MIAVADIVHSGDWVFDRVDLAYPVRNENIPTQCNFGKPLRSINKICLRNKV